jgi:multisubunit Na+/H+ antiporter MnhG subunit
MTIRAHTPWYRLPFVGLWRFATAIEKRIGMLRCLLGGSALALIGILCCLSFVGVLIGLPLLVLGITLALRGLI